ncbi:tetratricopeptide repeat protein [Rubinisphaera italica]|uniref:Photosystem I assembly protein Ycf3 n=1 Tax=Rubinisphaera italica TaxID=2527969 RepID=A0A5C5XD02_9PLAN|nr:hypothetical protein [Rubinisphaera italica]TWT60870.1 photosystem I assembly protein Ycf3 [Rubinisphaera italica]
MAQSKSDSSNKNKIYRLIILMSVLILMSVAFYWYRVFSPNQQYREALRISSYNPEKAELLLKEAIHCSSSEHPEWQFLRLKLLTKMNRWDEVLEVWNQMSDPNAFPAEDLCQLAFVAQQNGQLDFAQRLFQIARHDQQLRPNILRSLIQIKLQMGQEDLALKDCQELLELNRQDATVWQVIGTVHMTRKEVAEAEHAFRQCLKNSKNSIQVMKVREDLIQVLIDAGQLEQASKEWDQLQATTSALSERALLEKAWLLRTAGEYVQGLKILEELLGTRKNASDKVYHMRGMLLIDAGKLEPALKDFRRVTSNQPWNKEAHQQLAVVYTRINQPELAEQHRRIAEELNDKSLTLLRLNGELMQNPGDKELRQQIADLYMELGMQDKAMNIQRTYASPQKLEMTN